MDTIKHHLTESLLMGYSSGNLPEAFNLVVAAHISMCDDCRARLASYDAVGGAVLDDTAPACLAADSFEQTLARIKGEAPGRPTISRPAPGVLPAPLREYVGGDVDAIRWRPVGGGVKQAVLPTSQDATARLLRIPAGAAVPDHGHRGLELTLVLQGAFHDETDHFGRGDVEVAGEELHHTPTAETGEDCICLAATDAPLRFRALIPRLVQPFLGI
ncbi:ChrR family anti-sigma-E factor [Tranquillimonas alkanivorans]|uniref:Anti-ECFsigma factor, ChrR n=1 Tax=Tranquillimonas alkanivorans TaxID=441119 RepID=A0A1I5PRT0_9RHOB|nr:ChrR family anti-sigma-E factor [Tranquillimonas alkanivorans]SFP36705.1 anti-ECFsigma factor, ChrR [Tranquillimonas alkanivorans]